MSSGPPEESLRSIHAMATREQRPPQRAGAAPSRRKQHSPSGCETPSSWVLKVVAAALAGHAEACDRACVASEADVVAARCHLAPVAMLKAGAIARDLEPAAPHTRAIHAKPESAASDDLALAWLRELALQEDPVAGVPPAMEAPTADAYARSHRPAPGRDSDVDRATAARAPLRLSRVGQRPTQRRLRPRQGADRGSDRSGEGKP
jgi:hypothetical protein